MRTIKVVHALVILLLLVWEHEVLKDFALCSTDAMCEMMYPELGDY